MQVNCYKCKYRNNARAGVAFDECSVTALYISTMILDYENWAKCSFYEEKVSFIEKIIRKIKGVKCK